MISISLSRNTLNWFFDFKFDSPDSYLSYDLAKTKFYYLNEELKFVLTPNWLSFKPFTYANIATAPLSNTIRFTIPIDSANTAPNHIPKTIKNYWNIKCVLVKNTGEESLFGKKLTINGDGSIAYFVDRNLSDTLLASHRPFKSDNTTIIPSFTWDNSYVNSYLSITFRGAEPEFVYDNNYLNISEQNIYSGSINYEIAANGAFDASKTKIYKLTFKTGEMKNQFLTFKIKPNDIIIGLEKSYSYVFNLTKGTQTVYDFPNLWKSPINALSDNLYFINGTLSTANLPITYQISDPTLASISLSGNTAYLNPIRNKLGSFQITASQSGNNYFYSAPSKTITNSVVKVSPSIYVNNSNSFYYLNQNNFNIIPTYTNANLYTTKIYCASSDPTVADFSGQSSVSINPGTSLNVSIKKVGTFSITFSTQADTVLNAASYTINYQILPTPKFAVLGNISAGSQNQISPNRSRFSLVANAIKNDANISHIISAGDIHDNASTSVNQAQYYGDYITNNSTTNRFWPCMGDKDWDNPSFYFSNFPVLNNFKNPSDPYDPYFYNVRLLNKFNFIFFDSDLRQDSFYGTFKNSVQYQKLLNSLSNESDVWNILVFHHSPFTSSVSKTPSSWMSWVKDLASSDYRIHLVINGHPENFEIFDINGSKFINCGGAGRDTISLNGANPSPYSVYRNSELGYLTINQSSDKQSLYFSKVKVNDDGTISESIIKNSRDEIINVKRYPAKIQARNFNLTTNSGCIYSITNTPICDSKALTTFPPKISIDNSDIDPEFGFSSTKNPYTYTFSIYNIISTDSVYVTSSNPEVISIHPDTYNGNYNFETTKPNYTEAATVVSNKTVVGKLDVPIKFNILKAGKATLKIKFVAEDFSSQYFVDFEIYGKGNPKNKDANFYASSQKLTQDAFPVYIDQIDSYIEFPFNSVKNIEDIIKNAFKNRSQSFGNKNLLKDTWTNLSNYADAKILTIYNTSDYKIQLKQLPVSKPKSFNFNYKSPIPFPFQSDLMQSCVLPNTEFNLHGLNWKTILSFDNEISNVIENLGYVVNNLSSSFLLNANSCSNAMVYSNMNKDLNLSNFEVNFQFKSESIDGSLGEGCYFFLGDWMGNSTPQNYDQFGMYLYSGQYIPSADCAQGRYPRDPQRPQDDPKNILGQSKGYRFEFNYKNNSIGIYFNNKLLTEKDPLNFYYFEEKTREAYNFGTTNSPILGEKLTFDARIKGLPDKNEISKIQIKFRQGNYQQILNQTQLNEAKQYKDNSPIERVPSMGDFVYNYTSSISEAIFIKNISSKINIPISLLNNATSSPNRFIDLWIEAYFKDGTGLKSTKIRAIEYQGKFYASAQYDGSRYLNMRVPAELFNQPKIDFAYLNNTWNSAKISCDKGLFNVYFNGILVQSFYDKDYFNRIKESSNYFGLGIYADYEGKSTMKIRNYLFNNINMLDPNLETLPTFNLLNNSEVTLDGLDNLNQVYLKPIQDHNLQYKYLY